MRDVAILSIEVTICQMGTPNEQIASLFSFWPLAQEDSFLLKI
jgi:hypothetical protein